MKTSDALNMSSGSPKFPHDPCAWVFTWDLPGWWGRVADCVIPWRWLTPSRSRACAAGAGWGGDEPGSWAWQGSAGWIWLRQMVARSANRVSKLCTLDAAFAEGHRDPQAVLKLAMERDRLPRQVKIKVSGRLSGEPGSREHVWGPVGAGLCSCSAWSAASPKITLLARVPASGKDADQLDTDP